MEIPLKRLRGKPRGRPNHGKFRRENTILDEIQSCLPPFDSFDIRLNRENVQELKTIQRIILAEEDKVLSVDDVLSRVLATYRGFVHYR